VTRVTFRGAVLAAALWFPQSACAADAESRLEPVAATRPAPPRPLPLSRPQDPKLDESVASAPAAARFEPQFETRVLGTPGPASGDDWLSGPSRGARSGALVDLDLQNVDIANVCRLLADVGRVNIVVADDVHGTVTLRLKQVPWDRALDVILRTKGFRADREADVIVVVAK
jgi:hypothetical protein